LPQRGTGASSRRYLRVERNPEERDSVLDSEIDAVTCTAFVLAVFVIVPFTMLSPFRYPQPSQLDQLLSVNNGPVVQSRAADPRQFAGRFRAIDIAIASGEASASDASGTVRR
jgi:hypothetical protein